jgi:NTP pyrophosphatase (non-canonical NTP hydrolase)
MIARWQTSLQPDLDAEIERAELRYGPFTSTHEALGVLVEELDELRGAIRSNVLASVAREAMQVAAVALRLAAECRRATGLSDEGWAADAFAQRSVK